MTELKLNSQSAGSDEERKIQSQFLKIFIFGWLDSANKFLGRGLLGLHVMQSIDTFYDVYGFDFLEALAESLITSENNFKLAAMNAFNDLGFREGVTLAKHLNCHEYLS